MKWRRGGIQLQFYPVQVIFGSIPAKVSSGNLFVPAVRQG